MANPPVISLRDFGWEVAVFEGTSREGNAYRSWALQKSRKRQDGSGTYDREAIHAGFREDILRLQHLLTRALLADDADRDRKHAQAKQSGGWDSGPSAGAPANGGGFEDDEIPF